MDKKDILDLCCAVFQEVANIVQHEPGTFLSLTLMLLLLMMMIMNGMMIMVMRMGILMMVLSILLSVVVNSQPE